MTSNVGNSQIYEAGDQRISKDEDKPENQQDRNNEGKEGSHAAQDPKDERSIANRLDAASSQNDQSSSGKASAEDQLAQEDPLALARSHGNEPSKGAKIDAQILNEEEELIKKMDEKKAAKKGN